MLPKPDRIVLQKKIKRGVLFSQFLFRIIPPPTAFIPWVASAITPPFYFRMAGGALCAVPPVAVHAVIGARSRPLRAKLLLAHRPCRWLHHAPAAKDSQFNAISSPHSVSFVRSPRLMLRHLFARLRRHQFGQLRLKALFQQLPTFHYGSSFFCFLPLQTRFSVWLHAPRAFAAHGTAKGEGRSPRHVQRLLRSTIFAKPKILGRWFTAKNQGIYRPFFSVFRLTASFAILKHLQFKRKRYCVEVEILWCFG